MQTQHRCLCQHFFTPSEILSHANELLYTDAAIDDLLPSVVLSTNQFPCVVKVMHSETYVFKGCAFEKSVFFSV